MTKYEHNWYTIRWILNDQLGDLWDLAMTERDYDMAMDYVTTNLANHDLHDELQPPKE